ncbi:hypothetical protein POM88_052840 [Heracleum sosnowskyi]|uniref:F-box domain-containing protein n=1 Tax=Heracleum sosnowskyi TaxID=360622 RepID=A0AAD8GQ55_9APIA|nr:hypothetical protein POM88_052840 [Heracleum sosnowskyi]
MKNYGRRVKKVEGKDRLSDLHDDILIHIQSFLDVKSAAQTCVLSRRWRNNKLWIHHPDVYLNSKTFGKTSYKFREFVDMVLTQRDKLHHKIRSFSFNWTFKSQIPQELLDKVHAHVKYHDVGHFDLSICCASRQRSYPSQKFNPKSLTSLRLNLSNRYRGSLCTDSTLKPLLLYLSGCTTLKTLWLENISMVIDSFDVDLFSSLVDLTDLHIIGCFIIGKDRRFLVRAPRLERLTILKNICESYMIVPRWEISSHVLKYLRTDLCLSRPTRDCIDKLEIDFPTFEDYKTARHANRVINTLRYLPQAKSVTLSKAALQVISAFPGKSISGRLPPLPQFKWEHLKLEERSGSLTEFKSKIPQQVLDGVHSYAQSHGGVRRFDFSIGCASGYTVVILQKISIRNL